MTRTKLPPLVGLFAGLLLTALTVSPALAQLTVTWTPSVVIGGSTGVPFVATQPGNFIVTVRAPTGAPVAGAFVELDFSIVGTIRLIDTQNPGTTVSCPLRTLSMLTNAQGVAAFSPRFTGWVNGPQVLLRVNGINITTLAARSTAMSTTIPVTGLAALSLFSARYGGFFPEADFDVSGGPVALGDFSIFSAEYLRPQPPQGLCP